MTHNPPPEWSDQPPEWSKDPSNASGGDSPGGDETPGQPPPEGQPPAYQPPGYPPPEGQPPAYQPPGYPPPGYPAPGYPYMAQQGAMSRGQDRTTLFGWLGIVIGFLCCAIVGIVFGALSIRDARRFGNSPVLGYVAIALSIVNIAVAWTFAWRR